MLTIRRFNARTVVRSMVAGLILAWICITGAIGGERSGLQVIFFPALASVSDNNEGTMLVQGRLFTPAEGTHAGLVWVAAHKFKVKTTDEPFRSRARLFFSDGKRGARVSVKLGDRIVNLAASDRSGYFSDAVPLTAEDFKQNKDGTISFESVPSTTGGETVRGIATVVPRDALVVITDMDDTIKDTNVLDPLLKERNTMVNAFKPVLGMPQVYRGWKAAPGTRVHYHLVSAGPWQLYEPLRRFTDGENFPPFTWDMRAVDIGFDPNVAMSELHLKGETIFKHKVNKIRALMKRLSNQVVLVGDSGEMDPEVYANILNSCPDRVAAVFIREIPGARARDYDKLFPPGSRVKPQRFIKPAELPTTLTRLESSSTSECR